MVRVLGLVGHSQSGKSTLAKSLSGVFAAGHTMLSTHAQAMANSCGITWMDDRSVHDRSVKRSLYRWGRNHFGSSYWLDLWRARYESAIAHGSMLIVDDVAYRNEAQAIVDLGGKIMRVYRPETDAASYDYDRPEQEDLEILEMPDDLVDMHLINDGDFSSVVRDAIDMLERRGWEKPVPLADKSYQDFMQISGGSPPFTSTGLGGGGAFFPATTSVVPSYVDPYAYNNALGNNANHSMYDALTAQMQAERIYQQQMQLAKQSQSASPSPSKSSVSDLRAALAKLRP